MRYVIIVLAAVAILAYAVRPSAPSVLSKDRSAEQPTNVSRTATSVDGIYDLKYNLDNDTLTFTWEMLPGPEFGSTGQRVTVLRKIK